MLGCGRKVYKFDHENKFSAGRELFRIGISSPLQSCSFAGEIAFELSEFILYFP